ncbi:multicopper oxidase family protein [Xanthovirga aplysinae]|uniref:multicopper oxidase family protein n=1 Tax=Xanthovirga aplysinae TaxID=2529853 RepID=UPI0012BBBAD6|nr:multicopper oxidase domain-containing protein [Xanthovirga aplysinae]MTI32935.1 multicopper oxidase family protein [Xanthovirga aplysinae]
MSFLLNCSPYKEVEEKNTKEKITLLDAHTQEKFVNPLPIPQRISTQRGAHYKIPIKEGLFWLGLRNKNGDSLKTKMWGFEYNGSIHSPGPTFLTMKDHPINIKWSNQLTFKPHFLPVDYSLHTPKLKDSTSLPIVIHLHGGHTEAESDGYPESWYTQNYREVGPTFIKKDYSYDNSQEATTLWYHDHTVGMTRLNVYAGLYGFYLISDENEKKLLEEKIIPPESKTTEIIINDANFTEKGELYYPGRHGQPLNPYMTTEIKENWPDPTHFAAFFGTFIMANNMCWPKMEVEPAMYRFRLLNGSTSRTYILEFENQMPIYQIGSDGGFLNNPLKLKQLILVPAERADIIIDFSTHEGEKIILKNLGPDLHFRGFVDPKDPKNSTKLIYNKDENRRITDGFGGFAPIADPKSTGLVMRFDVTEQADSPDKTEKINFNSNTKLRPTLELLDPKQAVKTRKLVLFKLADDLGRTLAMLGTLKDGSLFFKDSITEVIEKNTIEIWEIYNTTISSHPVHLHQIQFQILDRQVFEVDLTFHDQKLLYTDRTFKGAILNFKKFVDKPILPQANEKGRKDTALVFSGQLIRLIVRFDLPGKYVWHCHILAHEDYDMMRPLMVVEKNDESP